MSDSDIEDDIIIAGATYFFDKFFEKAKKTSPRFHVRPFYQQRNEKGRFVKDFQDLVNDPQLFKETFRMTHADFMRLERLLHDRLQPKPRARPDSYGVEEKLAITLEFLSTGAFYRHISSTWRASKQSVGEIIEDTCTAMIDILGPIYMPKYTRQQWINASNDFNCLWNMPNAVGAIDGKHIHITCPDNAGSLFYNYKGFHSIVCLAVADAHYRFWYTDVGSYGSENDGGIFATSDFGKALDEGALDLPPHASINGTPTPFYFLADDAFPLTKRIMKPFTIPRGETELQNDELVFNYRLSRARRVVENAFGILVARWGVLSRKMFLTPTRAQKVVQACCLLHNLLMDTSRSAYCPPGFVDIIDADGAVVEGSWRATMDQRDTPPTDLIPQARGRPTNQAKDMRNRLKAYVNSDEGALHWQERRVFGAPMP